MKMGVVEFFNEFRRMCKSSSDCTKCEYHGDRCDNASELLEKTVAEVEQWSLENPRKTRQSVFLEQWPDADIDAHGFILICPTSISAAYRDSSGLCADPDRECGDCRREFWMQEVE